MTLEHLINVVRLGRQLTPAQSRAVAAQLERIPAMERTLAAKDKDFTQLSIAYSSAIEAGKAKGVQFTAEDRGYVDNALAECERLKEAVRWERECRGVWSWLNNTLGNVRADLEIQGSMWAARKAVEELLCTTKLAANASEPTRRRRNWNC